MQSACMVVHDMHFTDHARDGKLKSVSGAVHAALVTSVEGLHSKSDTAHGASPSATAALLPALQKQGLLTVLASGSSRSL